MCYNLLTRIDYFQSIGKRHFLLISHTSMLQFVSTLSWMKCLWWRNIHDMEAGGRSYHVLSVFFFWHNSVQPQQRAERANEIDNNTQKILDPLKQAYDMSFSGHEWESEWKCDGELSCVVKKVVNNVRANDSTLSRETERWDAANDDYSNMTRVKVCELEHKSNIHNLVERVREKCDDTRTLMKILILWPPLSDDGSVA